ncbi:MAG: hypothetical protein A3J48_04090 [Candidatus Doudnabacteria bacterium RIFCSPHIGHO2_02_FULL_46_11]|uniref:Uncharacterized protein n=1 Tax=Candidatus Doudnabacteria bacterium RIFCSPHIGHO2_02_FULL_46_11 TaxID=1817832 RepID=A0A1F5P6U0_9BACT|nr:MAG: hypothetical protein A3J48_04090 [Candidatus Doudnabacteria bacterium RIFCSPHIGHO2_02_FULL_46_11]
MLRIRQDHLVRDTVGAFFIVLMAGLALFGSSGCDEFPGPTDVIEEEAAPQSWVTSVTAQTREFNARDWSEPSVMFPDQNRPTVFHSYYSVRDNPVSRVIANSDTVIFGTQRVSILSGGRMVQWRFRLDPLHGGTALPIKFEPAVYYAVWAYNPATNEVGALIESRRAILTSLGNSAYQAEIVGVGPYSYISILLGGSYQCTGRGVKDLLLYDVAVAYTEIGSTPSPGKVNLLDLYTITCDTPIPQYLRAPGQ